MKFKNEKFQKQLRHLAPAYLRIGGTTADSLVYVKSDATNPYGNYTYSINETTLLDIALAAKNGGLYLLFDLNVGSLRLADGSWDSSNAEQIIQFFDDNNVDVTWELGNEPDLFPTNTYLPPHTDVNATQLANDIKVLKSLLENSNLYKNSLLVGPDVLRITGDVNSQANQYMYKYLQSAGNIIDAVTWHHYYFDGETAVESNFLDINMFESLATAIEGGLKIKAMANLEDKPAWLGETSNAYHSGGQNLSNKFIATFLRLDKLGVAAKLGLKVVIRQTVIEKSYALFDEDENANPDFWVSVLFKKLVGNKVLDLNVNTERTVRLYAHCTKDRNSSITVYGLNINNESATITFSNLLKSSNQNDIQIEAFELTSGSDDTLVTQDIKLNGNILKVTDDYSLPEFIPKSIDISSAALNMPPYSNVFWFISGIDINACS